jgi:hypothetical protein
MISIDRATGEVVDVLALPVVPAQIESSGDLLSVRSEADQAVAEVDLAAGETVKVTGLTASPTALAADAGGLVVGLGFSGETVTVTEGRVGPPTPAVDGEAGRLTLAGSESGVWFATIRGEVHAPDGTSGWSGPVAIGAPPLRLAVQGTRAWVLTSGRAQLIALLSGHTPPVRSPLRGAGVDLTADGSEAWIVTSGDDRLWRAVATSGRVVATRLLPGTPAAVLVDSERVWVAIASPASVIAFDRETLEPGVVVDLPRAPVDLALAAGRLVVAVS